MSRSSGKVSLLICLVLPLFSTASGQSTGDVQQWVFPQAAVGPFPPLGTYEIDLRLANRSATQWTGLLKLLEGKRLDAMSNLVVNDTPAMDASDIGFTLEARETKVFRITSELAQIGVLVIEGSLDSPIEHVVPSFNYRLREPAGTVADLIAVPPAEAAVNLSGVVARSGQEAFEVGVAFVRQSDLASKGSEPLTAEVQDDLDLELTYTDGSGQTQSVAAAFNFAPDQPGLQVAKVTGELFPELSDHFFEGGLLELRSNVGPVSAVLIGFGTSPDFRGIQNGVAPLFPTPLDFEDPDLKEAIREALGLGPAAPITFELAQTLTVLDASARGIHSLKGIESLSKLQRLNLNSNSINDINPLAGLIQLTILDLSSNSISDLSPLAGLTQLIVLDLFLNSISDVSPLVGLTQLTVLDLFFNSVSDVSPLAGLTQLTVLNLFFNSISDINPLAELTQLRTLFLDFNPISDINVLANFTQLESLGLAGISISDLSPLAGLTQLTLLALVDNSLSDISLLAVLIRLETLFLFNNKITDASPLTGLTELEFVDLEDNSISDISPLLDSCLGPEDFVDLQNNLLDADDCDDLETFASQVDLQHDVSCPVMAPTRTNFSSPLSNPDFSHLPESLYKWVLKMGPRSSTLEAYAALLRNMGRDSEAGRSEAHTQ